MERPLEYPIPPSVQDSQEIWRSWVFKHFSKETILSYAGEPENKRKYSIYVELKIVDNDTSEIALTDIIKAISSEFPLEQIDNIFSNEIKLVVNTKHPNTIGVQCIFLQPVPEEKRLKVGADLIINEVRNDIYEKKEKEKYKMALNTLFKKE